MAIQFLKHIRLSNSSLAEENGVSETKLQFHNNFWRVETILRFARPRNGKL
jgi:hypothetical protein